MAKKRSRRRYYGKGRWAPNIQEINYLENVVGQISSTGTFSRTATLVTNPAQNNLTTSNLYTVKNIEATFEVSFGQFGGIDSLAGKEGICCYIMFVPQGMNVSEDYNKQHPEYIMNYKYIGSPMDDNNQYRNPIRVKTRLARKLNTGDSIILFVKGFTDSDSTEDRYVFQINGLVRWWSKAN